MSRISGINESVDARVVRLKCRPPGLHFVRGSARDSALLRAPLILSRGGWSSSRDVRGVRPDVRGFPRRRRSRGRASRPLARRGPTPPRVLAKRSAKKRQSRKLEKREDVREGQKLMEERRAAAAAAAAHRPGSPPPPSDVADAAARVATRAAAFDAALETVGDRKREARESDAWDPARGYKPFDGVQDAVAALRDARPGGGPRGPPGARGRALCRTRAR